MNNEMRTLQEVLFTELEKSFINYLELEYVNEGKIFPDTEIYEDIEEEVDDIINDFFEGGYIDLNNIQLYVEQSDEELSDEELLQREINIFLINNRDWLINLLNSFFIENILK